MKIEEFIKQYHRCPYCDNKLNKFLLIENAITRVSINNKILNNTFKQLNVSSIKHAEKVKIWLEFKCNTNYNIKLYHNYHVGAEPSNYTMENILIKDIPVETNTEYFGYMERYPSNLSSEITNNFKTKRSEIKYRHHYQTKFLPANFPVNIKKDHSLVSKLLLLQ